MSLDDKKPPECVGFLEARLRGKFFEDETMYEEELQGV